MELRDYLRILRQRGWLILVLAALTAGAAFGYSQFQTEVYKASVNLLITSRPDFGQTQAARQLLRDYAAWLDSSYQAAAVIDQLQLDMLPQELMGDVTIAASDSRNIIQIEVENTRYSQAADIARVWGEQLIQWRTQENAGLNKEDRISAIFLDDPVGGLDRPQTTINTLAGAVFGAILGLVLIFILEWFASGIMRRPADIERYLDLPVVGTIPAGDR